MGVIKSKNLAVPNTDFPKTYGDQTMILNTDHTFTIDGTVGNISPYGYIDIIPAGTLKRNTTYTFTVEHISGTYISTGNTLLNLRNGPAGDGNTIGMLPLSDKTTIVYTTSDNNYGEKLSIRVRDIDVDNYTFRLQIEQGDTATSYTKPFIPLRTKQVKHYIESKNIAMPELTSAVDLGDGWYRLAITGGITISYNPTTGEIRFNGTTSISNFRYSLSKLIAFKTDNYTYSIIPTGGSFVANRGRGFSVYLTPSDLSVSMPPTLSINDTYTTSSGSVSENNYYVRFATYAIGEVFNNFTFKLQLEKDTEATEYEVPFTPYFVKTKKIIIPPKNLAIPDLNGKVEFNLDQPITELNGHTIREVFESYTPFYIETTNTHAVSLGNNNFMLPYSNYDNGQIRLDMSNQVNYPDGDYYFSFGVNNTNNVEVTTSTGYDITGTRWFNRLTTQPNSLSRYSSKINYIRASITNPDFNRIIITSNLQQNHDVVNSILINMTTLGIQTLTKEQMDYWYNIYQSLSNGERVYRLYNDRGVTIDYNIDIGEFIFNGTASASIVTNFSSELPLGVYVIKSYSSTPSSDSFRILGSLLGDAQNRPKLGETSYTDGIRTLKAVDFWIYTNYVMSNMRVKVQIEQGDTATDYEKPRNIITYNPDFNMEVTNND